MTAPVNSLSGLSQQQLQANLTAAQTALNTLLTGAQTVRMEYDGKMAIYTPAKMGDLRAYIEELQIALGIAPTRRHATSVYF